MHNRIYCSTGAFIGMANNRNYGLIAESSGLLNCSGYEFMMFGSWNECVDELEKSLKSSGCRFRVFHFDKTIGDRLSRCENDDFDEAYRLFEMNCRLGEAIGAELGVFHLWGGLASDKNIDFNIAQYESLREIARRHSILLTVENVVCNVKNPFIHLNSLHEKYPDLSVTIDTRFTEFHGMTRELFSAENAWLWDGAVKHVHFSDYSGGVKDWANLRALELGTGQIDFDYIADNLQRVGYDGSITLESTCIEPCLNIERINRNLDYIKRKLDERNG